MSASAGADSENAETAQEASPPSEASRFPGFVTGTALNAIPWLRHASSTRAVSASHLSRVDEIRLMQRSVGLEQFPLVHADQRHTATVGVIDAAVITSLGPDGRICIPQTDALVCTVPNVVVAIQTADCTPIFLADEKTRTVALVHAGWAGSLAHITEIAARTMVTLGSAPSSVVAWIGPAAGACCYEVSVELAERFDTEFRDAIEAGIRIRSERMLDLSEVNRWQLLKSGLDPRKIHRSGYCTIHETELFHSYRRDGPKSGRIVSLIAAIR